MKKIDLTGQKFGRLTVVKEAVQAKKLEILWECRCKCGNISTVSRRNLRAGHTKSCGCLNVDKIKERSTTHGMAHTTTFNTWTHMIQRCNNPNCKDYVNYGGRGIKVCYEWEQSFANFYKDMGLKPKGLTIERKNNELGYFKENCYWADYFNQSHNRRISSKNTVGVSGVFWNKQSLKWQVSITSYNTRYHLGYFNKIEDAIKTRQQAEQKYW